eukprot:SAG25_NODE_3914_length_930_cov_3.178099_1_plen_51_part_10
MPAGSRGGTALLAAGADPTITLLAASRIGGRLLHAARRDAVRAASVGSQSV